MNLDYESIYILIEILIDKQNENNFFLSKWAKLKEMKTNLKLRAIEDNVLKCAAGNKKYLNEPKTIIRISALHVQTKFIA